MSAVSTPLPALRRRNRALAIVILLGALAAAAMGTLYLRHYGFTDRSEQKEIRFH